MFRDLATLLDTFRAYTYSERVDIRALFELLTVT